MHARIALLSSLFAASALAATTSSALTALVWLTDVSDEEVPQGVWDGSVIHADASRTTYALSFPGSSTNTPTVTMGPAYAAATQTVTTTTDDPSTFVYTYTVADVCTFIGTTAAACTGTYQATGSGFSTSTVETTTYTETPYLTYYEVHITAGAEKLSTSATSTSTHNVAHPAATAIGGALVPAVAMLAGALL